MEAFIKTPGAKIRTYIDENGDDPDCEDDQGEPDDQPEVQLEEDPDYDEQVEKVKESEELIDSRLGQSQSFYIKARDVSKYGPTPWRDLNAEWPHEDVQEEDHEVDGG